jgi:hypothetical protein
MAAPASGKCSTRHETPAVAQADHQLLYEYLQSPIRTKSLLIRAGVDGFMGAMALDEDAASEAWLQRRDDLADGFCAL